MNAVMGLIPKDVGMLRTLGDASSEKKMMLIQNVKGQEGFIYKEGEERPNPGKSKCFSEFQPMSNRIFFSSGHLLKTTV